MANYNFENINYDNDLFYPRDTTNYLVRGTQQSATNLWTGSFPAGVSSYEDGLTINYYLPFSGNGSAVTLNLNSTVAKNVYLGSSDTQVTDQFPQNSVIRLTYLEHLDSNNGGWKVSAYVPGAGGTITQINSGTGLTGGPVTTSGTLKANLNDETSLGTIGTTNKLYAVGVDSNGKLAVNVPWSDSSNNVKDDGIKGLEVNHSATCSTAASTQIKEVTISTGTITQLENGLRVIVHFTNANTASNPQLKVNNLTNNNNINIYYGNRQITTDQEAIGLLSGTVEFVYNNNRWNVVGIDNKLFVVEFTADDIDGINMECNKTYTDIVNAINRKDDVICKFKSTDTNDTIYLNYETDYSSNRICFISPVLPLGYSLMIIYFSNNTITVNRITISTVEIVDWTTN